MNTPVRLTCPLPFPRRGQCTATPAPPRLARLTRLMALAIRLERLLRSGVVKDQAALARIGQVSRARVSQILALNHLAPDLQEALLFWPPIRRGRADVRLADVLPIAALPDWNEQRLRWSKRSTPRGGTSGGWEPKKER
jgi:hypothetical protein